MSSKLTIRVEIPGATDAVIAGGDSIDLGEDGVIVWLVDEDAEAYRITHRKRQREVRAVIERVGAPTFRDRRRT